MPSLGLPLHKLLYPREFSKFAQGLLTCVALQWCQDGANTPSCLCQVVIEGQCPVWAVQLLTDLPRQGSHWPEMLSLWGCDASSCGAGTGLS